MNKKLAKLNTAMQDISPFLRDVTGKSKDTIKKEQGERLKLSAKLGDDFFSFYQENIIYFDDNECVLIENIYGLFKGSHNDFAFQYNWEAEPSRHLSDRLSNARKKIREDAPPLIKELQRSLRDKLND